MSGEPYPKSRQLARGERRYRRKVASPKQWQAIRADKADCCRCCMVVAHPDDPIQLHHLVSRAQGGDDVPANLVGLCQYCHDCVTRRDGKATAALLRRLHDDEYAYAIGKGGEDFFDRAYGLVYAR